MDGRAGYAPVLLFRKAGRVFGMTTAIYQLAQQAKLDDATVDAFIESHTFPIVEDSCVTFVYRGEADAVFLQHWIFGLPSTQPFTRMRDSDLWFLIQEVPEGSRIEYKLEVIAQEESGNRTITEEGSFTTTSDD